MKMSDQAHTEARPAILPVRNRHLEVGGALHVGLGLGAVIGGGSLCVWSNGSMLHLSPTLLAHSPFTDFLIPGVVLYLLGVTQLIVAFLIFSREPKIEVLSMAAGAAVLVYLAAQTAILQFVNLFPIALALCAAFLVFNAGQVYRALRPATRL